MTTAHCVCPSVCYFQTVTVIGQNADEENKLKFKINLPSVSGSIGGLIGGLILLYITAAVRSEIKTQFYHGLLGHAQPVIPPQNLYLAICL